MKTIVLLSGGIDSTVALAISQANNHHVVLCLSFNYGQTHADQELAAAAAVADYYQLEHCVIDIRSALPSPSALTTDAHNIPETHARQPDATVVPGRNLVMLSIGVGIAAARQAGSIIIGANRDDHHGYPDCRPSFIASIDHTARQCTEGLVGVWAPLVRMTKQQIVEAGRQLRAPLHMTYSCYRGGPEPCNRCGACQSRNEAMAATA